MAIVICVIIIDSVVFMCNSFMCAKCPNASNNKPNKYENQMNQREYTGNEVEKTSN